MSRFVAVLAELPLELAVLDRLGDLVRGMVKVSRVSWAVIELCGWGSVLRVKSLR